MNPIVSVYLVLISGLTDDVSLLKLLQTEKCLLDKNRRSHWSCCFHTGDQNQFPQMVPFMLTTLF